MPTLSAPPRAEWPRHLFQRANGVFYARVRVPPRLGYSSTHLQRSLRTDNFATAKSRLTSVAGALKHELEALAIAHSARAAGPVSRSVEEEAAWFRDEAKRRGRKLGGGETPDDLDAAYEHAIDRRLGAVVGMQRGPDGAVEPLHQGEAQALRLADLALGRVVPIDDQFELFAKEQGLKSRYEGRCRRAVARLKAWMIEHRGTDDARLVGRPEVSAFLRSLIDSGLTTPTVNSLSSSLRVYWKWLANEGSLADANPWVGQAKPRLPDEALGKKRGYEDDEIVKLFNGKTYRTLHDLMRIGALTGMRINEIASLTVANTAGDAFTIEQGKNANAARVVPIHKDLRPIVRRRSAGKQPSERLFDELTGSAKREISARASLRFTEYRRRMGIDVRKEGQRQSDIDFHSWRRWFATKAEQAGHPVHIISAVTGHSAGRESQVVKTYSGGPSMEQKRAVVDSVKLPKGALVDSPEGPIMGRPEPRG